MPLRNVDYTDRELLLLIEDNADADGVTTADDLAMALGYGEAAAHKVTSRLAWMTRYGFLARNGAGWLITPEGREVMSGQLTPALDARLQGASVGQRVLMMRAISAGYVNGTPAQAAAVRREWLHQAAKR